MIQAKNTLKKIAIRIFKREGTYTFTQQPHARNTIFPLHQHAHITTEEVNVMS